MSLMAHFHQRRRTRIRIQIPNPIVTLYYAQLFPLVWIQIRIPVQIVSWMVTVPMLRMDLRPRDTNPNPSPLVEMSHQSLMFGSFWFHGPCQTICSTAQVNIKTRKLLSFFAQLFRILYSIFPFVHLFLVFWHAIQKYLMWYLYLQHAPI